MDGMWLSIGILIGWIAAWLLGIDWRAQDQTKDSPAPGLARKLARHRQLRHHAFRAVVTLVLIGVILTIWSMEAEIAP